MDKEGHILPIGEVWSPEVTDDVIDNSTDKIIDNSDVTNNVIDNVIDDVIDESAADKRRKEVIRLMRLTPTVTTNNLANILHVSPRTILRDIDLLRAQGKLSEGVIIR